MLPPMRAELSTVDIQSSKLASSALSKKALTLALSRDTWMPNCASQGTSVLLARSISNGICSLSSGTSLAITGMINNTSASKATIATTSTNTTAARRGMRRAASASTAGCSAYASTAAMMNGVSTGPSSHSSSTAAAAAANQIKLRRWDGFRDINAVAAGRRRATRRCDR